MIGPKRYMQVHAKIGADTKDATAVVKRFSAVDQQPELSRRHLGFALFFVCSIAVFWMPLKRLIGFSLTHDYASHIILVLPTSAYLIYLKRDRLVSAARAGLLAGGLLFLIGTILLWLAKTASYAAVRENELSVVILAIVVIWIAGFVFCYGTHAFALGRFPLLFLLLLVPIPERVVEEIIFLLQVGSATVAYWLLRLSGVAVFKQGFILQLPSLDIEVAKQCSGIRSSLALLLTALLVGEFTLRSGWRKALLLLSIVPILILKNGVRITAVSLLSIFVNRGFLHGWLHTSGGILFYLLSLVMLIPIFSALRKSEDKNDAAHKPLHSGT